MPDGDDSRRLAASRFVRRRHKVIDGCIAVDRMCDGFMVAATPQLSEIEKFGYLGPDVQPPLTAALYIDDMRASMSVKKVAGAGSPIARRCAFVGHLRNAVNTAAVIELFVSIITPIVPEFSADTVGINGTTKRD